MFSNKSKRLQFLRSFVDRAKDAKVVDSSTNEQSKTIHDVSGCDDSPSTYPLCDDDICNSINSSPIPPLDPNIQEELSNIINEACLDETDEPRLETVSPESILLEHDETYSREKLLQSNLMFMTEDKDEVESVDDSVKDKNYETESSDSLSDVDSNLSGRKKITKRKGCSSVEHLNKKQKRAKVSPNLGPSTSNSNINLKKDKKRGDKGETRKVRNKRQLLRNLGKEYISKKGKVVVERKCRDLQKCRLKCNEKLDDEIRQKLFFEYWSMGNYNKRVAYVADLIFTKEKQTTRTKILNKKHKNRCVTHSYHVRFNGQLTKVCKKCFLLTFDETNKFLTTVINKKQSSFSGITQEDGRGKGAPFNKTSDEVLETVRNHVSALPCYESHYCRKQTENKFLPPHYTLTRIYKEYKKWIPPTMTPVSRRIYETIFHNMKIKIKSPKKDSCARCDKMNMQIKNTLDIDQKQALQENLNKHQLDAEYAYQSKRMDKQEALNDASKSVYTFDLQQCLPTPDIQTSVAFYKRQLWTYNLTIHRCEDKQVFCCMWDETTAGRGANQIASSLYKHLSTLGPEIRKVTLYSDTCPGQNKNSYLPIMYMLLLKNKPNLEYIEHKFLEPGHTHMECDTDHSIIEKKKKKHESPIEHPRDWMQLVRMCGRAKPFKVIEMQRQDFFEFSALLKTYFIHKKTNDAGEQVVWKNIKWLRFSVEEFGILQYKTTLNKEDPFKKIDFKRKSKVTLSNIKPPLSYKGPVPINPKKKNNLLELLPYINQTFHSFYQNLVDKDSVPDILPESGEESESE